MPFKKQRTSGTSKGRYSSTKKTATADAVPKSPMVKPEATMKKGDY